MNHYNLMNNPSKASTLDMLNFVMSDDHDARSQVLQHVGTVLYNTYAGSDRQTLCQELSKVYLHFLEIHMEKKYAERQKRIRIETQSEAYWS
jgi:hypothetical protein